MGTIESINTFMFWMEISPPFSCFVIWIFTFLSFSWKLVTIKSRCCLHSLKLGCKAWKSIHMIAIKLLNGQYTPWLSVSLVHVSFTYAPVISHPFIPFIKLKKKNTNENHNSADITSFIKQSLLMRLCEIVTTPHTLSQKKHTHNIISSYRDYYWRYKNLV